MKKILLGLCLAAATIFASAGMSAAEEAKPTGVSAEDIKKALGMSIYLQGGYTYNLADPDSGINQGRVFDQKANTFSLDLAQLVFTKDAPVGGIGYKLKLSAGETAKYIHAAGLGSTAAGETPHPYDLTEAYISYIAPLGKGLKFQAGKFVTMHGAEVIEAKDNMNYSRSFLFNYAIPFTHTGVMIGYSFTDQITANLYVVNGWDNFNDEGKSKTLCLSTSFNPSEQISLMLNLMNGREVRVNAPTDSNRFLTDFVATVKPFKNFTFVLNTDYAKQSHDAADGSDAKWYGLAGYAKYDFSDLFSAAIRAEYFNDNDGVRTGTAQKLKEVTLTPEFRIAKDLIVRPEYRHDWSDRKFFDSSHTAGNKKGQDTIALGVMYTW